MTDELRKKTGIGVDPCRRALELCGMDIELAYEFLRLKSQAVSRYKTVDGVRHPYTDKDYLELAKRNIL